MDEKGTFVISQFGIESGSWVERPASIRIVDVTVDRQGARSRHGRGSLVALVERRANGYPPVTLVEELTQTLEDTYYQLSGSITRGLREALLAANQALFERNLRADDEHRCIVGLNCAVLRDNEVYLGQVGPALACLMHEGQLSRYPQDSAWLRSAKPGPLDVNREPPAGLRRDIEPTLHHFMLTPGDALVLSTTALAGVASADELHQVVARRDSEPMRRALMALAAEQELAAVVIEYHAEGQAGERQGAEGTSGEPARRTLAPTAMPAPPAQEQLPPPSEAPPPREAPIPAGIAGRAPSPLPGQASPGEGPPLEEEDLEPWEEEDAVEQAEPPLVAPRERPRLGDILSQEARKVQQGTQDLLLRALPDRLPEPPPQEVGTGQPGRAAVLGARALVVLAMLIPLVMVFLVIMTRLQYERTRRVQFDELLVTAQARYDAANRMENQSSQRQELYAAMAVVEDGLSISPEDERLNALRRQIQHKLDQLNTVERLFHFWQLLQLDEDPVSPTDSSRLVIQGINVFLLNRGSDRVLKYLLNDVGDALQPVEGDPVLVQKGAIAGGVKVGDIVDVAWLEAGGQRTLSTFVMLDRNGTLLAYDPQQGIDALPVADSDSWLKPAAIGGYFGNLYILDPLIGRILKYAPTENAYTTPPTSYLNPNVTADLTGAVDLAVDGNMYVLFADGKILKFLKGDQSPFSMDGLPTPMRSPTGLVVSGPQKPEGQGYVYVADAGNERVLQFDKSGKYIRQFQAVPGETQLRNLRGIYVDEEKGRLFALSGRTLWLTELPKLQPQ